MNFNMSSTPDYQLQGSMSEEVINLFGIKIKLLIAEKVNQDKLVFGDYSHLKTNSQDIFELFALPELQDSWDDISTNFSQFGLTNSETIALFISRKSVDDIFGEAFDTEPGFAGILGNLIVLPNARIVEISNIDFEVPGINNMFAGSDQKNIYKLTCKTYNHKLVQEVLAEDLVSTDSQDTSYSVLDEYFNELTSTSDAQDDAAEIETSTDQPKVILDVTEDSVFGSF